MEEKIRLEKCIDAAEKSEGETRNKDISTACSNMARMLVDAGDFFEAYDYIKRAINAEDEDGRAVNGEKIKRNQN